jgi:transposase
MMRPSVSLPSVTLCTRPVDFRKGAQSLALLVAAELGLNPFAEQRVVLCNRGRTGVKILYWERNGFCLWQKRLEQERFRWPKADATGVLTLTGQQVNGLLDGYDLAAFKPHRVF